jgi:hypothetical protein
MMSVPIARRTREHGDDHVRLERPHDRHDVAEDRVPGPVPECLVGALRESEVIRPREVLAPAVDPPRGKQLFGAYRA